MNSIPQPDPVYQDFIADPAAGFAMAGIAAGGCILIALVCAAVSYAEDIRERPFAWSALSLVYVVLAGIFGALATSGVADAVGQLPGVLPLAVAAAVCLVAATLLVVRDLVGSRRAAPPLSAMFLIYLLVAVGSGAGSLAMVAAPMLR